MKRLLTVACLALAQLLVLGAARASAQPAAAEGPAHGHLRVRDARHGPQLQDDRPQLVRHDAHQPPAVLRPGVRRGRQHLRRRAPDPPGRQGLRAHLDGRAADHVRVRNVRHGRGRRPDDVPAAARLRRARPVGRGPVLEPVHGHRRLPELARVPGVPPAWCSSGTCRCGICPSRATRASPLRSSGRARAATPACSRTASSSRTSRAAARCPTSPREYRMGGSKGYVEVAGLLGRMEWDDLRDDAFDLSGSATRWGLNFSTNIKLGSSSTIRGQLVVRRRHPELHERRAGRRRHRPQPRQPRDADQRRGDSAPRQRDLPRSQLEQPVVDGGGLLPPGHRQHGGPGPRCVPAGPVRARQPALHAGARA